MNYLITYEDALKICEAYKNFNFFKTEHCIDGYKIVTFNYFLCDYQYFINPIDDPNIHALDMRGVTFVFNKDGSLFKRFLMLKKFFNVNQVEETQINLLKDKKIKHVTVKEDGSLIAFMKLPDGNVFSKTQGGFTNEQSIAAMEIYNHKFQTGIKKFVDEALDKGFTPLFEYVAYDNRIVLKYSGRELRLIGIRDNDNGKYYSASEMSNVENYYGIPTVKTVLFNSLNEIEELMKTSTDMEGVVVEFEDNQLVKFKTEWYVNLHGIRTVNIFREDYIISNYLNETLDEVTQDLNMTDDADAFKFIEDVKTSVKNWADYIDKCVDTLVNSYPNYESWAAYATKNYQRAFFGLTKTKIEKPSLYTQRKIDYMLNATKHLMEAKKIVEKWKV